MDSGAEEHVASLSDWKSLGEPLLKPAQVRLRSGAWMVRQPYGGVDSFGGDSSYQVCSVTKLVSAGYSIEMRPTQSVLRHSGGGCILLQRCGKRGFLSIRVRKSCEINAITFCTMKREVQSTVNCVHCVPVTCLPLKSDFPGHLGGRNIDTRSTVTLSVTNGVKSA